MIKILNNIYILIGLSLIACEDNVSVSNSSIFQYENQLEKDTNVIVCGNFNVYKKLNRLKVTKNCIEAYLYFKFRSLDFEKRKEKNYSFNDKILFDSIPEVLIFQKGPVPFFCSDISIANAEIPKVYVAIKGDLRFTLIKKDQLLIYAENFKCYSAQLKDTIILQDTILCNLKYNNPG